MATYVGLLPAYVLPGAISSKEVRIRYLDRQQLLRSCARAQARTGRVPAVPAREFHSSCDTRSIQDQPEYLQPRVSTPKVKGASRGVRERLADAGQWNGEGIGTPERGTNGSKVASTKGELERTIEKGPRSRIWPIWRPRHTYTLWGRS